MTTQWPRTGLEGYEGDNLRFQLNDEFMQSVVGNLTLLTAYNTAINPPVSSSQSSEVDYYPAPVFLALLDGPLPQDGSTSRARPLTNAVHTNQTLFFGGDPYQPSAIVNDLDGTFLKPTNGPLHLPLLLLSIASRPRSACYVCNRALNQTCTAAKRILAISFRLCAARLLRRFPGRKILKLQRRPTRCLDAAMERVHRTSRSEFEFSLKQRIGSDFTRSDVAKRTARFLFNLPRVLRSTHHPTRL